MPSPRSPLLQRQSSGFNRDERQWPFVRIRVCDYEASDFESHFAQMVKQYERGQAVVLYDVRQARIPTTDEITLFSRFIREHRTLLKERCLAVAVLTSSRLQRGVLTAIQWVTPFPIPLEAFADADDAQQWLRARHPGLSGERLRPTLD